MKIVDLNGKVIEVENLDLAFQQADACRHYRHTDSAFAQQDEKLQTYWEDVYQKLLKLKTEQP
ncbi:hypothetical protein DIU31_031930 [Mucilaginibacter rubeus]|uniref:3-isopropylmalate dehydratase n=1 Tax=Mucilaginibacter rubeus TaxID=2027860 RepID=A0AAE6JM61_9SPHI|nr:MULTISPECIES: hypothetical protein [Mucilaginibacter]QEM07891.1 hypothetical protein DIU31_031930 [Mucilaginibacter rubeus]QEM20343.1 hypothetical protein DIU38_031535 [Mucilaginibacter gossypii]QTE42937.1 hypothetical protein J3L19_29120 [Mucilaginibacter rubeus]QTE49538.1 hypothetical protein J3L21_29080 [Mucilaginibacter rubeus]QTE54634.1 hypothetical protein J3L23_20705 [Mucilaginibacter rubeus]